MPVKHVKDIPSVSRRTWHTLSDEEKDAIEAFVESFEGDYKTDRENLEISNSVGPGAVSGTAISFYVYSDTAELPDGFSDQLREFIIDAGIAKWVSLITKATDPNGKSFHDTKDHQLDYRAYIHITGKWNIVDTVHH